MSKRKPTADKKLLDLHDMQQEELRLLNVFAAFCEEHDLTFYLDAGTLIGAVRHQGFIPWDDDIDLTMPRPDYERMIALAGEMNREDCHLQGYWGLPLDVAPYARYVTERVAIYNEDVRDYDTNLWIDIFPIDGNPDDEEESLAQYLAVNKYRRLMGAGFMRWHVIDNKLVALGTHILGPILRSKAFRMPLIRRYHALQTKVPFGSTQTVGSFANVSKGNEHRMPLGYLKGTTVTFEGGTYPAMSCYDEHLTRMYGDYMTPPPEDKRIPAHSIRAWWVDGFEPEDGDRRVS